MTGWFELAVVGILMLIIGLAAGGYFAAREAYADGHDQGWDDAAAYYESGEDEDFRAGYCAGWEDLFVYAREEAENGECPICEPEQRDYKPRP